MPQSAHMLVGCVLRVEIAIAGFALKTRSPVTSSIHMLIASFPGTKRSRTGLAFGPVVTFVHVVFAVFLPIKIGRTVLAFEHLG